MAPNLRRRRRMKEAADGCQIIIDEIRAIAERAMAKRVAEIAAREIVAGFNKANAPVIGGPYNLAGPTGGYASFSSRFKDGDIVYVNGIPHTFSRSPSLPEDTVLTLESEQITIEPAQVSARPAPCNRHERRRRRRNKEGNHESS